MSGAGRGGATPYEQARDDPAFLHRFAGAYRGAVAPLDALWWREHPEDPAPSGAEAPDVALAVLRLEVYSPSARPGAIERYRRLQAEQDREREAVEDALARAEAGSDPPVEPPEVLAAVGAPAEAAPEPSAGRRVSPPVVLAGLAVAAAFVAGVLAAPALGIGAPQPTASATAVDTPPPFSGSAGSGSALSVFAEPQRDVDRPPIDAGARLLPQTFRRLSTLPSRGVDVYAAEDSEGDVCLVALSVGARLAVACTTIADLRREPLRLAFRADVYRDATTTTGEQVQLTATWGYLGRFALEETPATGE